MKEKELREKGTCGLCKHGIGKSNSPLFMRVKVTRHILKLEELQRQQGLAMIMGPDKDMTEIFTEHEITVCEDCSLEHPILHRILEQKSDEV